MMCAWPYMTHSYDQLQCVQQCEMMCAWPYMTYCGQLQCVEQCATMCAWPYMAHTYGQLQYVEQKHA
jgi:hypothetical protein